MVSNKMSNEEKIKSLPIWKGIIDIKPLEGGITNLNYVVNDSEKKLVVRLGSDIPAVSYTHLTLPTKRIV